MTRVLTMSEQMVGWIQIGEGSRESFRIKIAATTTEILRLRVPRVIVGQGWVGSSGDAVPVRGTLIIHPLGPEYDLTLTGTPYGDLRAHGRKKYALKRLLRSLTTCPMTVYKDGEAIGSAELAYRDSIIAFPLKALRLETR